MLGHDRAHFDCRTQLRVTALDLIEPLACVSSGDPAAAHRPHHYHCVLAPHLVRTGRYLVLR